MTGNRNVQVVVVHNHPIHYKTLLFNALSELRNDVCVYYLASGSSLRQESQELSRAKYRFHVGSESAWENLPSAKVSLKLLSFLEAERPMVVVLGGYMHAAFWAGLMWTKLRRSRSVLWYESNKFDRPRFKYKEWIKRQFVSRVNVAQVYGTTSADYLEDLGLNREKIFTKMAVVDVNRFSAVVPQFSHDGARKRLLYVGRFAPEKNLQLLLSTLREIQHESLEISSVPLLRLVGYGPLESKLRDYASVNNLCASVEFCGAKRQQDLCDIFAESDALILPSTREPWGLTVNEAMAAGLPAIVSDRCGCAADLVKPETGWMFNAMSQTSLKEALLRFAVTSQSHLQKMGKAARRLGSLYTADGCAERVNTLLKRLCGDDQLGFRNTRDKFSSDNSNRWMV